MTARVLTVVACHPLEARTQLEEIAVAIGDEVLKFLVKRSEESALKVKMVVV